MAAARAFLGRAGRRQGEIVVIGCQNATGRWPATAWAGAVPYPVTCAGNLHSSVIEVLLRGGCDGVLVVTCPPRDCWHREGPRWLTERVYHGREAELQERVDRARVRVVHIGAGEVHRGRDVVTEFVEEIRRLADRARATADPPDVECRTARPRETVART